MALKPVGPRITSQEINDNFSYINNEVQVKVTKSYVDQMVANIGDGSPKGVFSTLTALQAAYPLGSQGVYIVSANGNWYYWNGSSWVAGGLYQGVGIGDGTVTTQKLKQFDISVLTDKAPWGYVLSNQQIVVDWATKTLTCPALLAHYDIAEIRASSGITAPLNINVISWLILKTDTKQLKYVNKVGFSEQNFIVLAEFFVTDVAINFRTTSNRLIKITNYSGEVYEHISGRDLLDQTVGMSKLTNEVQAKLNGGQANIYSFKDAWASWLAGQKFPIAFFGDSTIDGMNTTGWASNTIGSDSASPNAYPKKLQDILREATGNSILRVYNAGFSGQTAAWGLSQMDAEFSGSAAYSDVKMIGIGFGINDRLAHTTQLSYRNAFKTSIKAIINWCFNHNIQPFLLTTQAILAPGVDTSHGSYPLRTGETVNSVANEVKKELAEEFGLELIDFNKYTQEFLLYSQYSAQSIISDRLHFGDVGHKYEAEMVFAHLSPRTIFVNNKTQIDYSAQQVTGIPENWLSFPNSVTDGFKVCVNHTKETATDIKIFDAWIFVTGNRKRTIKAYKSGESETYAKLNGVIIPLTTAESELGDVDLGVHHLEVFSGNSTKVDFKGFVIE